MRHKRLNAFALSVAIVAGPLVIAQESERYDKGKITGWHQGERTSTYSTSDTDYGSGVKRSGRTSTIRVHFIIYELRSGNHVYEFESRKKEFEVGQDIEFRITEMKIGLWPMRRKVAGLLIRMGDGKDRRFIIVGENEMQKEEE